jgi:hypothetical protein
MVQADTRRTTTARIMRSADFKAGVEDVRAGRPARFDEFNSDDYERGRQWAMIVPAAMPLRVNGNLNPEALRLFDAAFDRGDVT